MNLYNVWRQSIVRTTEKLKQIQEQEKKSFKLKGTYIFGLVDNPDPWTEVELSKLFEIGLYKMFEINTKPRYKASVVISVVLSQIRMVCQMIAGALRQGITDGFSGEALRESVTKMVETVGLPLSITEQQEWASIPDALVIAQSLRQPCHGTEIAEVRFSDSLILLFEALPSNAMEINILLPFLGVFATSAICPGRNWRRILQSKRSQFRPK